MKPCLVMVCFSWEPKKAPIRSAIFFTFITLAFFIIMNTVPSHAQSIVRNFTISGRITDSNTGQPIPLTSIRVKGDSIHAVTDPKGEFTITVPDQKSILVISSPGYKTVTLKSGNIPNISLAMVDEELKSDELVAVGYGIQPEESVLASVYQVSGDFLSQNFQGNDLSTRLVASIPGLNLKVQLNGLTGFGCSSPRLTDVNYQNPINIRGLRTWNNSGALVLVDGAERPFENISPYEIDKVTVLRDAAGTSPYGVKAANGVILITTLRGREGKPRLSINGNFSLKSFNNIPGVLGSYEANLLRNYAILNEVPVNPASWNYIVPYPYLDLMKKHTYPEYLPDVNWKETLLKNYSTDRTINMTVTGGTRAIKYFTSLTYSHEDDPLRISEIGVLNNPCFLFDRFNFRGNLDFYITPLTRLSSNLQGYFLSQRQSGALDRFNSWNSLAGHPPDLYPVRYSDGFWADYQAYARVLNPVYLLDMYGKDKDNLTGLSTDFILNQDLNFITEGLSVAGRLSFDNTFESAGKGITGYGDLTKWINPEIVDELRPGMSNAAIKNLESKYTSWQDPMATGKHGFDWVTLPDTYTPEIVNGSTAYRNFYYELSSNYAKTFGKHSLSGLVLFSRQEQATGSAYINYREDWAGRVTYGFDKRYLVELNGAYNGSEKFGPGHKFGFFPSLAVGWVVSNEAFFEKLKPYISKLKFRYSEGLTGSDAGIERWLYIGRWIIKNNTTSGSSQDVWRFGTPLVNAYPLRYEGIIPNPDIRWETSHMKNIGIESGFLNDQLKMSFDYFTDDRTDILVKGSERIIPDYFGRPAVSLNLGRIISHGFELGLQFSRTSQNGLKYWFNHSWTYAAEKIIQRADLALRPAYQKLEGFQIDQPKYIFNQSPHPMQSWNDVYNTVRLSDNTYVLPGDFCQVDYNADGIIDSNDLVPYGYTLRPQYFYSPGAGLSWKNLSVRVRFYGIYNISGMTAEYQRALYGQYNIVYPNNKTLSWSPEFNNTENATNPAMRFRTTATTGIIDNPLSCLVLQNVEIACNISPKWLTKKGMSNLRFAINGNNLYVWARSESFNFSGFEPPVNSNLIITDSLIRRISFSLSFNI